MSLSNRDRVGRALDQLNEGLLPFVMREFEAAYGPRWRYKVNEALQDHQLPDDGQEIRKDVQILLKLVWDHWNEVFRNTLGQSERNYVSELRTARNKWAHQESFSTQETLRTIETLQLLLKAISASAQAEEAERQRMELMRIFYNEQERTVARRSTGTLVEGDTPRGLLPWRQVITPHPDVASGNFEYAEFAADLSQVYHGIGSDEYCLPRPFFQRTFLTNGLRQLLKGALRRLSGVGGDPIVELQTNFGGGKTHSLLALYHLFSGIPLTSLIGVDQLLMETGLTSNQMPSQVKRVVLVGHALSPAQIVRKDDGCEVHTMWGELAWQLLGKEGYALVAEDDRHGVSPGSTALRELLQKAGPTLILIDEWVVFVRQLYHKEHLPAGSFEANLSFAQNLTEAAKALSNVLIVATIPASDTEKGGEGGVEAATRLKQIFGRLESPWRPADVEEGFEIVRRRLFEEIPTHLYKERDAVASAFSTYYQTQRQDFPSECSEASYEQRIKNAYPIHPELFDRLFSDWSGIEKFQRTRGVLRLMASVIHELWTQQDHSLLILPAMIPVDTMNVQAMFTQYLEDNWVPIIEKDVDGNQSLPKTIDNSNAGFGRYSAARRVARTIFFGSAPTLRSANKGLQDIHIKLGCAQPGETVATFGDALRRLAEQATYLYQHDRRYWYDTQASVQRLAQDRASQYDDESVYETIKSYLKSEEKNKGDFARIHTCPNSGADVIDENSGLRLIILPPQHTHARRDSSSEAVQEARRLLATRSSGARIYRNTLIFLAADRARIEDLKKAVRLYKAWEAISEDRESLNLDVAQSKLAGQRRKDAESHILALIPEVYHLVLVPEQPAPLQPEILTEYNLQRHEQERIANAISSLLRTEELLITKYAGVLLRQELDRIPLWRGDQVTVKELVENFAKFVYLPRLKNADVLLEAIRNGVQDERWRRETFAYAEGWDGERYIGLRTAPASGLSINAYDSQVVLVKSQVAEAQLEIERLEAEERARKERAREAEQRGDERTERPDTSIGKPMNESAHNPSTPRPLPPSRPKAYRFNGSVSINERRMANDAGKIMDEVVRHLTGLTGASVRVSIEIEAELPAELPEGIVRTVKENSNTLHFQIAEFHEE